MKKKITVIIYLILLCFLAAVIAGLRLNEAKLQDLSNNCCNKGRDYISLGLYKEAEKEFTKAIMLKPDNEIAHYGKGRALTYSGNYNHALFYLNIAIFLNDTESTFYVKRGNVYKELAMYKKALTDYDKAIQLNNTNEEAYLNKGIVQILTNNFKESIDSFEQAKEINGQSHYIWYYIRYSYLALGKYEKALSYLDFYISHEPEDFNGYLCRSAVYEKLNDKTKALSDLHKAQKQEFNYTGEIKYTVRIGYLR